MGCNKKIRTVHLSTKHTGLIFAWFAAGQALLWVILSIYGLKCISTKCGKDGDIAKSFHKYTDAKAKPKEFQKVTPYIFKLMVVIYFVLSILWLLVSLWLIIQFTRWYYYNKCRNAGNRFLFITFLVCLWDFIVFFIFLIELIFVHNQFPGKSFRSDPLIFDKRSNSNLQDTVLPQHKTMRKLKPDIKTISNTETNDSISNPLLQKKIWDNVPWLSKNKSKMKENAKNESKSARIEDEVIFSLGDENIHGTLKGGGHTFRKQEAMAAAICLVASLKGFVAWGANVILWGYFKYKMRNFQRRKPTTPVNYRILSYLFNKMKNKKHLSKKRGATIKKFVDLKPT